MHEAALETDGTSGQERLPEPGGSRDGAGVRVRRASVRIEPLLLRYQHLGVDFCRRVGHEQRQICVLAGVGKDIEQAARLGGRRAAVEQGLEELIPIDA